MEGTLNTEKRVGAGAVNARKPPSLDDSNPLMALQARLNNNVNAAGELATRLEQLADRLLGPVPEVDGDGRDTADRHYANGHIGELHENMKSLDYRIGRAATAAGRLSHLAE